MLVKNSFYLIKLALVIPPYDVKICYKEIGNLKIILLEFSHLISQFIPIHPMQSQYSLNLI